MQKKFKHSFGVKGSVSQIAAFKEFAESVGWKFQDNNNSNLQSLYFNVEKDWPLKDNCFWYAGCSKTSFGLPLQWDEAMKFASEEAWSLEKEIDNLADGDINYDHALGFEKAIEQVKIILKKENLI